MHRIAFTGDGGCGGQDQGGEEPGGAVPAGGHDRVPGRAKLLLAAVSTVKRQKQKSKKGGAGAK